MTVALTQEQLDFRYYLLHDYPAGLVEVAEAVPTDRRLKPMRDGGVAIHRSQIGVLNSAIRRMDVVEQDLFAVATHWCQVLDQGVWLYHRECYASWRTFAPLPKIMEDRPGRRLVAMGPPIALRHIGGRSGDFMARRLVRWSMVHYLAPAVIDLVDRLAGMNEMPCLLDVVARELQHRGIAIGTPPCPVVDPLRRDAIDSWRMPVLHDPADLFGTPPSEIRHRARRRDQRMDEPK